jgi:hypothetical protein
MSDPAFSTVLSTGPGFYAASTRSHDDLVPAGKIRMFVARIEAYDGPLERGTQFDKMQFNLLPAMADGDKAVARALLALHSTLTANLELLKKEAS